MISSFKFHNPHHVEIYTKKQLIDFTRQVECAWYILTRKSFASDSQANHNSLWEQNMEKYNIST